MPPTGGLTKQFRMAKGYAENGAGFALIAGLAASSAIIAIITTLWGNSLEWNEVLLASLVLLCATLMLTRFVASGAAYGVLNSRNAACELWQRRLDRYILTGAAQGGSVVQQNISNDTTTTSEHNDEASLLTPLAIVTGANSGVGLVTAETLLQCGYKVVMGCRNAKASAEARAAILEGVSERVMSRYREAFDPQYASKAPLAFVEAWRKGKNGSERGERAAEVEGEREEVQRQWQAVRARARTLLQRLPSNIVVVPLDVGDLSSIDGFIKTILLEHEVGRRASFFLGKDRREGDAVVDDGGTLASSVMWENVQVQVEPSCQIAPYQHDGLRLIVNNAGCCHPTFGALPRMLGCIEGLLAVNYVGPTYLTTELLKGIAAIDAKLEAEANAKRGSDAENALPPPSPHLRIINLSSVAHSWGINAEESNVSCSKDNNARRVNPSDAEVEQQRLLLLRTPRLRKILEALSTPDATPANNAILKRFVKNTYGLSKMGAIALTRALAILAAKSNTKKKIDVSGEYQTSTLTSDAKSLNCFTNVSAYALHPGAVRTAVFRSAPRVVQLVIESLGLVVFKTVEEGAATQVMLSLSIEEERVMGKKDVLGDDASWTHGSIFKRTKADDLVKSKHGDDRLFTEVLATLSDPQCGQTLFSDTSLQPANPNAPVGWYYCDKGPVTSSKGGCSSSSECLASAEALSDECMLAMHAWAMERVRRHKS